MNERIRELAEQLGYNVDFEPSDDETDRSYQVISNDFAEKFAELIVQECVKIADEEDFDVMMKEGYPCSQTAKKIKQHFGVE
jgi:adenosine/AMP kinase